MDPKLRTLSPDILKISLRSKIPEFTHFVLLMTSAQKGRLLILVLLLGNRSENEPQTDTTNGMQPSLTPV